MKWKYRLHNERCHLAGEQFIPGHFGLRTAVAPASPDHRPVGRPLFRFLQHHQFSKPAAHQIGRRLFFAAAAEHSSRLQAAAFHLHLRAAVAPAPPDKTPPAAAVSRFQCCEPAESLAAQIVLHTTPHIREWPRRCEAPSRRQ